jgi:hypothetical protein
VPVHPSAVSALAAGAIAGALVLGLIGRMATAAVALVTGHPPNLSLNGLLEVAVAGALLGILGGLLLLAFRRGRQTGVVRGVLVGVTLFLASVLASWLAGRVEFGVPASGLMFSVVALVYAGWGLSADALLTRFERKRTL